MGQLKLQHKWFLMHVTSSVKRIEKFGSVLLHKNIRTDVYHLLDVFIGNPMRLWSFLLQTKYNISSAIYLELRCGILYFLVLFVGWNVPFVISSRYTCWFPYFKWLQDRIPLHRELVPISSREVRGVLLCFQLHCRMKHPKCKVHHN